MEQQEERPKYEAPSVEDLGSLTAITGGGAGTEVKDGGSTAGFKSA